MSLADEKPDLVAQWHPTKNALTPKQHNTGSHKKVWWKCPKGPDHEWQAPVRDRALYGYGCPFCSGRRVSITNCLATVNPGLAAQWHPTNNGSLSPSDVTSNSSKKVWWLCSKGPDHEWQASPNGRRTYGCPFCSGHRLCVSTSLATKRPDIAVQWHPTKNGILTPNDVTCSSGEKVWWKCPNGPDHEWKTSIANRTNGTNCPFCSNRRVSAANSLASLHPTIAVQWHPTKNGSLTPYDVTEKTNRKVWWKCPQAEDHEWYASVYNRIEKKSGCPCCSGRQLSKTNSLATCYPDIATHWHPTKNGDLTPKDIVAGSTQKVWWKCSKGPDHEWFASPAARTGCPYCAGQQVSITNSLANQYPEVAAQWHPTKNGDVSPHDITWGSNKMAWWKCSKGADHEWQAIIKSRTSRNSGCPFCSNRRVSITNCLQTLFPKIAFEWVTDLNDELTASDVLARSRQSYWWRCPLGHTYKASVANRTVKGLHCPVCRDSITL